MLQCVAFAFNIMPRQINSSKMKINLTCISLPSSSRICYFCILSVELDSWYLDYGFGIKL